MTVFPSALSDDETIMTTKPTLVWLRHDLRISDNPALSAAAATGSPLVILFILETDRSQFSNPGGASEWWLHHSLYDLSKRLEACGHRLILRAGAAAGILRSIIRELNIGRVYWNRRYTNCQTTADTSIKAFLTENGVEVKSFAGNVLSEPWVLKTKSGTPFRVFTPFWKSLRIQPINAPLSVDLSSAPPIAQRIASDELQEWQLLPSRPNWADGFAQIWQPGEKSARRLLEEFLTGNADEYKNDRDRPDKHGTSALSPHLAFGEISPRQIWHTTQSSIGSGKLPREAGEKFLSEIAWREFAYSLLYHNPDLPDVALNPKFQSFPWEGTEQQLQKWQTGCTGYPFVDAGMRQLWKTGWMHNRVRMVTASFLTKHLLIDWRAGAEWFWDTLVDADLANNSASWQWVAGCGADAAPYFRIFNPVTQGEKFDPNGDYVRKYVPELRKLPKKYVHQPWNAPQHILDDAGVILGKNYPLPMIDHKFARTRALAAYESIK